MVQIQRNTFFILILFCLTAISVEGQNNYSISQFGTETQKFIKQPYFWKGNDWLRLGLVGAGTLILIKTSDEPVRSEMLKNREYINSIPIEFGRLWGEPYAPLIFSAAFFIHSWLADDIQSKKIGYEIGQSALYSGAVVYLIKYAFGRERPYMNNGNESYYPFKELFNKDNKSLPSGHSAMAFSLSAVLSKNLNSDLLKGIAYIPAVLTLISRMYQDKHWLSDTFLGATIGYLIANWVVKKHNDNKFKNENISLSTLEISIPIF